MIIKIITAVEVWRRQIRDCEARTGYEKTDQVLRGQDKLCNVRTG
jgi:hypothetical protein